MLKLSPRKGMEMATGRRCNLEGNIVSRDLLMLSYWQVMKINIAILLK